MRTTRSLRVPLRPSPATQAAENGEPPPSRSWGVHSDAAGRDLVDWAALRRARRGEERTEVRTEPACSAVRGRRWSGASATLERRDQVRAARRRGRLTRGRAASRASTTRVRRRRSAAASQRACARTDAGRRTRASADGRGGRGRRAGKTYFVTGGASGLGEATVRRLASQGANVAILDRDTERGQAVAKELGSNVAFFDMDATQEESVKKAVDATVAKFGGLNGCVNCAGVGAATLTLDKKGAPHASQVFDFVMKVNLCVGGGGGGRGARRLTRRAVSCGGAARRGAEKLRHVQRVQVRGGVPGQEPARRARAPRCPHQRRVRGRHRGPEGPGGLRRLQGRRHADDAAHGARCVALRFPRFAGAGGRTDVALADLVRGFQGPALRGEARRASARIGVRRETDRVVGRARTASASTPSAPASLRRR